MLGVIVFSAAGIWILVIVLVLGLCQDAKAGDEAVGLAPGPPGRTDGAAPVIELLVRRRESDSRRLSPLV